MALPDTFPPGIDVSNDHNPAIRLFGKRFLSNQSILEFLVEFLTVAFSEKCIGDNNEIFNTPFPEIEQLRNWPNQEKLFYRPLIKLNLKLFAFFSSSRIDSRHEVHIKQYEKLWSKMKEQIHSTHNDADSVIEWIEELLRGFRGAGFNRTWCAQTFFPVSTSLLTQETIWNETIATREPVGSWIETMERFPIYYSTRKHNFMARGGELLYLQLCNVFAQDQKHIEVFAKALNMKDNQEIILEKLHQRLQKGMGNLYGYYNKTFDNLVEYIEGLDQETIYYTQQQSHKLNCEWCPSDSWQESYLFALELSRLLNTALDPVERLELLTTGCSLQILRSLCSQSIRYLGRTEGNNFNEYGQYVGNPLKYAWIFTPTTTSSKQLKLSSQRNLQAIQVTIQKALRNEALINNAQRATNRTVEQLLNEADDKYGYKLFLLLGKKLGIIVPFKGPGARFIMTDSILRYLVLTLLQPGDSCTYDEFLEKLYFHYGIAVEGKNLMQAVKWSGLPENASVDYNEGSWLTDMLRAGGFLTELSDAYSIITNTFEQA